MFMDIHEHSSFITKPVHELFIVNILWETYLANITIVFIGLQLYTIFSYNRALVKIGDVCNIYANMGVHSFVAVFE